MEYGSLDFKILAVDEPHSELLARACNLPLACAAFDKAIELHPTRVIELRHGARIVETKRPPP